MLNAQVGDLVRWFDYYQDNIVKSAGIGVIIDQRFIKFDGYGKSSVYYQYLVCTENHISWFGNHNLELIGEKNGFKSST
jgi:hypothetical protein